MFYIFLTKPSPPLKKEKIFQKQVDPQTGFVFLPLGSVNYVYPCDPHDGYLPSILFENDDEIQ